MNLTDECLKDIAEQAKQCGEEGAELVTKCLAENPFAKETFNLTRQCKIAEQLPELAKLLETRANDGNAFTDDEKNGWLAVARSKAAKLEKDCAVRSNVMNGHWA